MQGNIVRSLLLIGAIWRELGDDELSIPLLLAGLIELIVVVAVVLGDAGGVRPENLLAIKFGNRKSACGLRREGAANDSGLAWWGEKYGGLDRKEGGEGGKCGVCSGEEAGDDLGDTSGDSSEWVGEGVPLLGDCRSLELFGEVSKLFDKSNGVSAIMESIVLL